MTRYIFFFIVAVVGIAALAAGAMYLLRPTTPTTPVQQQGSTTPLDNTYTVQPSASSKDAVQAAFRSELAKHESDNTKLYATAIVGEYALQVWAGDVMGGQALLKYDAGQSRWILVDGGGGAWSVKTLVAAGVPTTTAETLLANLPR